MLKKALIKNFKNKNTSKNITALMNEFVAQSEKSINKTSLTEQVIILEPPLEMLRQVIIQDPTLLQEIEFKWRQVFSTCRDSFNNVAGQEKNHPHDDSKISNNGTEISLNELKPKIKQSGGKNNNSHAS